MLIWIVFCLMAFAAIIAVLWPLSRPAASLPQTDEADIAFYKGQFEEIERDRARGLLTPEEAEAAKAEAGRRLLQVARHADGAAQPSFGGHAALWRRRVVAIAVLVLIPVCALPAYLNHGVPDYAAQADEQKIHDRQIDEIRREIAKREQYLQQNPNDGAVWENIAYVYLRMGQVEKSVAAYEKAIKLLGESSERMTGYGEALLGLANQMTDQNSAEAQFAKAKAAFEKAAIDPRAARARVYLGIEAEEAGNIEKAREYYTAALKIMPEWADLRERLARLDAPKGAAGTDAGSDQPQIGKAEIDAMVENMAERLDQNGGSAKEWAQLTRSYVVQKQKDKAVATLAKARKALAGNSGELAEFNAAVGGLGLEGGK